MTANIQKLMIKKKKFAGTLTADLIDLILNSKLNDELMYYLPFKSHFCKHNEYIDGIEMKDMKQPIMWGFDADDCLFIAVKNLTQTTPFDGQITVETFFQRYRNSGKIWTSGNNGNRPIVQSRMGDREYEILKSLIHCGQFRATSYFLVSDLDISLSLNSKL